MNIVELFTKNLTKVYDFVKHDACKKKLFLQTISDIHNNEVGLGTSLQNLYLADPEMVKVKDAISDIVFILKGLSPEIKKAFNEDPDGYDSVFSFNIAVQETSLDELVDLYKDALIYNTDEDSLTIIGDCGATIPE